MKASEKAAAYLAGGMKSELQVRQYLARKGYSEEECDEAVEELKEYHFIDDYAYAVAYFRAGFEKKRGERRIRRELEEKGVKGEPVEAALRELTDEGDVPDEYEQAMEVASSVVRDYTPEEMEAMDFATKQKLRGRIVRRLGGRGFSGDVSYRVAKELVK